ncbi:MAG: hypothetical protein LBB10_01805, partial [Bifidobacteriaceae bacterium]|nr:hypothetical protein [Bifidobacteriaceae bacterium]
MLFAIFIALFRYQTSPLWSAGNNSDIWVYQIMGNAWNHGVVPYKDLFDVKGPAWYMLFSLLAYITPWSNAAPFIFLILIYTISFVITYKISKLFLSPFISYCISSLFCFLTFLADAYSIGFTTSFTVEEVSVPFILFSIYITLEYFYFEKGISKICFLLFGVCFAFTLWSKYQLIAPTLGIYFGLFILCICKKTKWMRFWKSVLHFVIGFVSFTAFIFLVLLLSGNFFEMFKCYFLGQSSDLSIFDFPPNIYDGLKRLYEIGFFNFNNPYGILFILFLIMLLFKRPFCGFRITIISFFLFIFLAESLNMHDYNRIILFIPVLFALIGLMVQIKNVNSFNFPYKIIIKTVVCAICISFSVVYYFQMYNLNMAWWGRIPLYKHEPMKPLANFDIPQYKSTEELGKVFEDYIQKHSNGDTSLFANDTGSSLSAFFYNRQIPGNYYFFNANYKPFENLWHFRDKIYKSRQYKWVILSTEIDYSNQILS